MYERSSKTKHTGKILTLILDPNILSQLIQTQQHGWVVLMVKGLAVFDGKTIDTLKQFIHDNSLMPGLNICFCPFTLVGCKNWYIRFLTWSWAAMTSGGGWNKFQAATFSCVDALRLSKLHNLTDGRNETDWYLVISRTSDSVRGFVGSSGRPSVDRMVHNAQVQKCNKWRVVIISLRTSYSIACPQLKTRISTASAS